MPPRRSPPTPSPSSLDRFTAAGGAPDVDREVAARICDASTALPLAIELAASAVRCCRRPRSWPALDERFRILRSADRTVPERQRTMTALLDWSYDLLTSPERAAFERLSCFAGTFASTPPRRRWPATASRPMTCPSWCGRSSTFPW